ncbi:MAG: hypothetical protein H6553_09245 [Chitinophagales bacterium]|nr:hypothetical protein [Chitinophagales bacterium]
MNIFAKKKKLEEQIKPYYFVMLTTGPNRTQDDSTIAEIQKQHLANINHLAETGVLKLAGPFADDGFWKGLMVLDVATYEIAEEIVLNDPAVKSGRLHYEIKQWYTSPTMFSKK